jgi:vacuolar-type H+-ATPase subunit E/Vma4
VGAIKAQAEQKAEDAYNHRIAEGQREISRLLQARNHGPDRGETKGQEVREEMLRQCFAEVSAYLKTIRTRPEYPALYMPC